MKPGECDRPGSLTDFMSVLSRRAIPFPPFYGAITRRNQPLIRWCYLIKTAQCVAYTLIMTNLEKGGSKVCEGGGGEREGVCADLIGSSEMGQRE